MANRVTHSQVVAIRPTKIADTTPFIDAANSLVTSMSGDYPRFDAARLELIELWLSAHLIASADPMVSSESFEGWKLTYKLPSGYDALLSTQYGQTANALSDGILSQYGGSSARVEFL